MSTCELFLQTNAQLAEGPVWVPAENRLYWLDIERHLIHRTSPDAATDEIFDIGCKIGCLVPIADAPRQFLAATQRGIEWISIPEYPKNSDSDGTERLTRRVLANPEADKPDNRYNDGKCSPDGRFFFGSLNMKKQPLQAALYSFGKNVVKQVDGLTNSNGLGWSPDGQTMYLIDTPTLRVDAFDYWPDDEKDKEKNEEGKKQENKATTETGHLLFRRRTVVRFPADGSLGRPDGMTVDAEGMVWIAHWLGGQVSRWNPHTGKLLEQIFLPVRRVTSVTFGDPDFRKLWITTAKEGMTAAELESGDEPLAGSIFVAEPSVGGLPVDLMGEF